MARMIRLRSQLLKRPRLKTTSTSAKLASLKRKGRVRAEVPAAATTITIISWNLLRLVGASADDVAALIRHEQPDLLLMQEATEVMDALPERVGGHYARALLPGRIHGLAIWSRQPFPSPPRTLRLQAGSMFHRVCQVLDLGDFAVANVHLSHGQMLNRRQLRRIAQVLPPCAAVLGDYNLLGPALLPGFRDVGPRHHTHAMIDLWPLRLDRCLVRGIRCVGTATLPRHTSDHRPILVRLALGAHSLRAAA